MDGNQFAFAKPTTGKNNLETTLKNQSMDWFKGKFTGKPHI
jgi:hypothetical protein